MTEFWLSAGLLLLAALAFLLLPILRGHRRQQAEQDRTALNVALYEERVAELAAQQAAGVLDDRQLATGRDEAARELLADTERDEAVRQGRLGKAIPLLAAVLVPVMALGLYLHFGAADKVELTQEFASAPQSMTEMTTRLERAVQVQPDSAEGLYFLGRAYMAEQRPADAAKAFERAVALAGRQPELLGQWAQALYFAADKQWSAHLQALTDEALQADPREVTSLGLRGIAAFEGERFQEAIDYWQRLLAQLPEGDASRAALQGGIDRAADRLKAGGGKVADAARLKVRVELGAALKDKVRPDDTVFIFARASNGPPMPLAAKRVTVAQLPIEVELSDADAMMPQMKLSDFTEVQLVARVSRAGVPTRGEWKGQSAPLATTTQATQHLTIDSPDP
ncbi:MULTISPECIES: c-type cytochrome biogenesis protein CcmI [unclassified Pseudomonas]|uniref:c-type cytochrome biogenesis protein CcmI n=1 Tax=unclassified Pseudomonas TaxID=196821 RepID=UPI000C88BF7F|nr:MULTISPECIES: c-type cytochrome biogenesis protein CcmI [unclassified Pseudomonas]PMZ89436.1 c-type cytochrome biogenesis protein CcmI [Pseudomonas sp. FW305-42]PNA19739.1 c-type cytochrome biogenesis protein CcmI [Pseudomonas sp. MPR-R1B]PNB22659.1 c-type cytochrome biogenesis protein CcmI [Pseudomonas sp. DP16D-E2]PNB40812.1 c-type cytochrome biogenesis protein CcmI [Pseudomonas sp. FW305-17]PNB56297.1 c-type cytochrome biogenesis protein CcmI [Pseudomonas sp. GW531-E2]